MKRKIIASILAALFFGFAQADEDVTMAENEITTLTLPFGIRGYTPSNKDVVRIEKTGDTKLRLTALKQGRCDIEVKGDLDLTQKYQITVAPPLAKTLDNLQRELESIPEVHAYIIGNSIKIEGEINSVKKWDRLMKVIKCKDYDPVVKNFVEFWPGDDILQRMKESLQQAGFAVVFNAFSGAPETWKGNCVALTCSRVNRQMLVQARVYTPEQQAMIMECFKKERRWLKIEVKDKDEFDDTMQVTGLFKIIVAKPQIRLSVAYMAVGDQDIRNIGNPYAATGSGVLGLDGVFGIIQDLVHGRTASKTAQIGASLDVTARFLAKNGLTKVSNIGYTTIESWDKDGAMFKSGGTRFIKIYNDRVAELKEVPYGFTINAKGGMESDDTLSMAFDFGLSSIVQMDDESYDRKEDLSKQKISLKLGRTTLVSGFMDLVDKNTPPSGLPFFRSTPVLNWFVADSGKEVSDRKLVIMICPEIVDNTKAGGVGTDDQINKPLDYYRDRTTDQVLDDRREKKAHTGFWSWLDWFSF